MPLHAVICSAQHSAGGFEPYRRWADMALNLLRYSHFIFAHFFLVALQLQVLSAEQSA
jgi:hypothetical protein